MQVNKDIQPQTHMFICTRTKEGECCGNKGSMQLRTDLKDWVKKQGLQDKVKVTASLCLGQCSQGITVCIYPENKWLLEVTPEDIELLKEELLKTVNQ